MKTIEQVLKEASLKLFTVTRDRTQAWLEAELLLSSALQQERIWLLAHQNTPLRATAQTRFSRLLARRLAHEPLAYIFGEAFFHGRMFLVNRSTLIPRVETEQLVAEAATIIDRAKQNTLVWDVGTGSGILAITLKALFPRFDVSSQITKTRTGKTGHEIRTA